MYAEIIYVIYMCKWDLVLNIQQWLICHNIKPKQTEVTVFSSEKDNISHSVNILRKCRFIHEM